MEESNITETGENKDALMSKLCFPYGPIFTTMEFLEIEEILNFRLVNDKFFEEMYFNVLSNREWTLDELFMLNKKTSEEFRNRYAWYRHNDIISTVVGKEVSKAFDTIVVKYKDEVTTDFQERLFPLFVPKGKKNLKLRTIEHLFVLVYGNWPYRYDSDTLKNRGSMVYWYYNGKGAELLDFKFLDDQIGVRYSSDMNLRSIPRSTNEAKLFKETELVIQATVEGIIHYQPHFGFGDRSIPVTRGLYIGTVGRGFSYISSLDDENPLGTNLVMMSGKGGQKTTDYTLEELCLHISSGRLFPHFYEILDRRQHQGKDDIFNSTTTQISTLFLKKGLKDVKIASAISRIVEKKMKKEMAEVEYSYVRHTIAALHGQRHPVETFRYPCYQVLPMR